MANLKTIAARTKNSTMSLDKLCKIKNYLPIKEKFEFAKEYKELLKSHIKDYPDYESFVAFVFFNLMVVNKYTDIELELTYDEFDILQENGLIDKIVEIIGDDYSLLLKLIQIEIKE